MADRIIFVGENDRASYRGIKRLGPAHWMDYGRLADDRVFTFDYTGWLNGDTISSVTRTASGLTVAGDSNTTTQAIQRVSGTGYVDIKITTAAGMDRTDRLEISLRSEDLNWPFTDYS